MYEDEHRPFPPGVGDPFGREVDIVRREAELAGRAAHLVGEAIAVGRRLTLGREAGSRLWRRPEVSRVVFAPRG